MAHPGPGRSSLTGKPTTSIWVPLTAGAPFCLPLDKDPDPNTYKAAFQGIAQCQGLPEWALIGDVYTAAHIGISDRALTELARYK